MPEQRHLAAMGCCREMLTTDELKVQSPMSKVQFLFERQFTMLAGHSFAGFHEQTLDIGLWTGLCRVRIDLHHPKDVSFGIFVVSQPAHSWDWHLR